jgi:3-deoxy-manno-octulosonate cytidylyltransferase (CMP-KDO synthetase)
MRHRTIDSPDGPKVNWVVHPSEIQQGGSAASSRARVVGAIPARFGSTRLPGKALHSLAGRPMIEHVYRRAASAIGLDRVVVLTDDERIARVVSGFGGDFEMTPTDCASGTDRIAWAARRWDVDAVINIQGDEPLIDPDGVARVAAHLRAHPGDPIVTLAADALEGDLDQASVVKTVLDRNGYALYFSRAAIPFPRHPGGAAPLRHLGIYGYQKPALLELAALPQTPLEKGESLEQLRALENGIRIRVLTGARPSWGVDTLEDAEAVDRRMREEMQDPGSPPYLDRGER